MSRVGVVPGGEPLLLGFQLGCDKAVEQRFTPLTHLADFLFDAAREGIEHVFAGQRLVDLTHPFADALQQKLHIV